MGYKRIKICDFCHGGEGDWINKCDVCGRDSCSMCGFNMHFLGFFLCKHCAKIAKKHHKNEILKIIKSSR